MLSELDQLCFSFSLSLLFPDELLFDFAGDGRGAAAGARLSGTARTFPGAGGRFSVLGATAGRLGCWFAGCSNDRLGRSFGALCC
jgi:hypothetical protein